MTVSPDLTDPRVRRTRAAAITAARVLFLQRGYAGTTMEDIAAHAGLTKRTLYNNYPDKEALFRLVIAEVLGYADAFVRELPSWFADTTSEDTVRESLTALATALARRVVQQDVVAVRRLVIGESRVFPDVAAEYFSRAPGRMILALGRALAGLHRSGLLHIAQPRVAAEQFAYLIMGAPLDRAMMTGQVMRPARVAEHARAGVETFLARYAMPPRRAAGPRRR